MLTKSKSKCRSCSFNYALTGDIGIHQIGDTGLYCPLCHYSGESIFHGEHETLTGNALECNNCNNYIIYFYNGGKIMKDELYFDNDYCLIRYVEDNTSIYFSGSKLLLSFNKILDCYDKDILFDKLKTYVLMS
jgi:hypothetical protein